MRTKHPVCWRRVLYQRSMCVVSPVSLPALRWLPPGGAHVGLPEATEATALAIGLRHRLPKCLAGTLAMVAVGEGHDLADPGGTSPSRASACSCAVARRTRPRQTRSHHWPWLRTGFPRRRAGSGVFLATADRLARDPEGAAESPQRGALLTGTQHLGLAHPAIAALVLLAPVAVAPAPDDVRAAALAAVMNLAGHDHCCPPWDGWRVSLRRIPCHLIVCLHPIFFL